MSTQIYTRRGVAKPLQLALGAALAAYLLFGIGLILAQQGFIRDYWRPNTCYQNPDPLMRDAASCFTYRAAPSSLPNATAYDLWHWRFHKEPTLAQDPTSLLVDQPAVIRYIPLDLAISLVALGALGLSIKPAK